MTGASNLQSVTARPDRNQAKKKIRSTNHTKDTNNIFVSVRAVSWIVSRSAGYSQKQFDKNLRFASKVESHQRQLVEVSGPTYKTGFGCCFVIPPTAVVE